jgi:hypothetical protein
MQIYVDPNPGHIGTLRYKKLILKNSNSIFYCNENEVTFKRFILVMPFLRFTSHFSSFHTYLDPDPHWECGSQFGMLIRIWNAESNPGGHHLRILIRNTSLSQNP